MDESIAWLGLDGHSRQCVLAQLDDEGKERGWWSVPTTSKALVAAVKAIPQARKRLMLEECELSRWLAGVLRPVVEKLVVCDPRENHLLSRHHDKRDERDAYTLARLLRLQEYKEVWQPTDPQRIAFRHAARGYEDAVRHQTRVKQQIKSQYRQWGVMVTGSEVFNPDRQHRYLKELPAGARHQVELLGQLLMSMLDTEKLSRRHLVELGRSFPEVARLRKVPGIGLIGSNLFVAYLQDPGRFRSDGQLIRYCQLGIRSRSSDNKPLGYQRLDRSGYGTLKAISYRAWLTAVRRQRGVVWEFYLESKKRTGSEVHARLNTQRKVITTMWRLWLKEAEFDPKRFLSSQPSEV